MRAKEYAKMYLGDPSDTTLLKIVKMFYIDEIKELIAKRGIRRDAGLAAAFREQDQKWRCFARQCAKGGRPEIREDGFRRFVFAGDHTMYRDIWPGRPDPEPDLEEGEKANV